MIIKPMNIVYCTMQELADNIRESWRLDPSVWKCDHKYYEDNKNICMKCGEIKK